jgi:5'-deoxynucleotidase YfbR-like HD superfamily hydrolase
MDINNLNNLVDLIHKWSSITRYSQKIMIHPESVAEHTSHVGLIAMWIARDLESSYTIDFKKLYELVIIHDLDEVVVGDIPKPTKESSKELDTLIRKLEHDSMKLLCREYKLPPDLYELWSSTLSDSIEGAILRAADIISVYSTALQEYKMFHNEYFGEILNNVGYYISVWVAEGLYKSIPELEEFMLLVSDECERAL